MYGKMQESWLTEIIPFTWTSLIWGQCIVFHILSSLGATGWVVIHTYFSPSSVPLGFTSWHWRAVTTADCDILVYWYGRNILFLKKVALALGGKRARKRPEQWWHFFLGTWRWLIMDPTFLSSSCLPPSWLLSACLHPPLDPAFLEFKSAALHASEPLYSLTLGFAYLHTFNKCCIWTVNLPYLIRQ